MNTKTILYGRGEAALSNSPLYIGLSHTPIEGVYASTTEDGKVTTLRFVVNAKTNEFSPAYITIQTQLLVELGYALGEVQDKATKNLIDTRLVQK